VTDKPKLPAFPKYPRKLAAGVVVDDRNNVVFDIAERHLSKESDMIRSLVVARDEGRELVLDRNSAFVRMQGCRQCPYYATSFCWHGMWPPEEHGKGICMERLNELLDIAQCYGSADGLLIRKREAVERVRRQIVLLSANFTDYRNKRLQALSLDIDTGMVLDRVKAGLPVVGKGVDAVDFESLAFDEYEERLLSRLQALEVAYAKILEEEEKIGLKKDDTNIRKAVTLLDVGKLIRDSRLVNE